jgi:hypothetical protein
MPLPGHQQRQDRPGTSRARIVHLPRRSGRTTLGRSRPGYGRGADAVPFPARVAALNAARDRAAGQSREQVKELYQAELRARSLDIPMAAVLDVEVSLLNGSGTGPAGRALVGLVKRLYGIGRPAR